jgi:hypothetical protein
VFATSIVTLISPFLISPPNRLQGEAWFKLAVFVVALVTGLWLIPMKIWSRRAHLWRWWAAAGLMTALSVTIFLHYASLLDRWTILYFGDQRLVVGDEKHLTEDADAYKRRLTTQGPVNDSFLLRQYAGDPSKVWWESDIVKREHVIVAWYMGALLLLASAPITVAQAVYCASSKARAQTRRSE